MKTFFQATKLTTITIFTGHLTALIALNTAIDAFVGDGSFEEALASFA